MSGLIIAYLAARRRAGGLVTYKPKPMTYFSVQQALERLGRLLGALPDWSTLEAFLPDGLGDGLERRAAMSATLVAGLEMARDGSVSLRQDKDFAPIMVKRGAGA
jgi:segregation and condensation protein A